MFEIDPYDQGPVSVYAPGDCLPDGSRAWDRLGVGHRCETWLAWSDDMWFPVVVKFPRPHQISHPRARRSLTREARALAGVAHPALPRLLADGTAAAVPYLAFEHLDGVTLADAVDDGAIVDPVSAALLGAQLLAGLHTVHRRGVAHVDIKPDNVVMRGGRPVLIDFGSSRRLGARQPSGLPVGSPGYAAPDLEAGEPISAAMDLYGLGVTLYEAMTGRAAFDPDDRAAVRPDPDPLPPSDVTEVVLRLLAPDPTERPTLPETLDAFGAVAAQAGQPVWPAWACVAAMTR